MELMTKCTRIRIRKEIFENISSNFDKFWAVLTNFSEKISKKNLKDRTKPGNMYYLVRFVNRTKLGTVLIETVLRRGSPFFSLMKE